MLFLGIKTVIKVEMENNLKRGIENTTQMLPVFHWKQEIAWVLTASFLLQGWIFITVHY